MGTDGPYGQDDPDAVAAAYLRHLADWCARFAADGFAPVRSAWLDRAEGLGAAITVRLGREELQGRFRDFGHDGALMLERPDGTVRPVVSGEIVQTVPAG